jgi:two-component system, cell cycle sensor histidine kinase and response regulator CckA
MPLGVSYDVGEQPSTDGGQTMTSCQEPVGTETIMLVEDEYMVREVTKRILERGGYTVLTAANGKEALDLYSEERNIISLIILDFIMPEMSGKECLAKLREVDPNIKILVTSGYHVDGMVKEVIESGARGFIGKPYDSIDMLRAVRKVLDCG